MWYNEYGQYHQLQQLIELNLRSNKCRHREYHHGMRLHFAPIDLLHARLALQVVPLQGARHQLGG